MNRKRITVIALSNRDYSSLSEKLAEAVKWLDLAAVQGADLVVLPECLNRWAGDGAGHPRLQKPKDYAAEDWRVDMAPLCQAAERQGIWVTVPVVHWDDGKIFNSFFLVSPEGEAVWRYDKVSPTPSELESGVVAGRPSFYDWQGIRVGGAICFDSCFPENLAALAAERTQLVLFPSLWPGGSQVNTFCKIHACRVALSYPAWSRIVDIDGKEVAGGGYRHETLRFGFGAPVYGAELNFDRVSLYGNHNQEKIVAILQKYGTRVQVSFDQENCLWFLDSCDPDLSEQQIMREFELVSAVDYFAHCAQRVREATA